MFLAIEHPPLHEPQAPFLQTVGDQQASPQRCCQNSLIGVAGEDVAAGLEGDLGHETERVVRRKTVKDEG